MNIEKMIRQIVREEISNAMLITEKRTITEHRTEKISDLIDTFINKNEETTRSSFNLTNSTIGRLNRFTKHYKLQNQDIVELAIIQILEQFDRPLPMTE
ncbi:hypothetical protein HPK19_24985 (plasmid) [Arthrobacter citreus]|nr:hypothetical protein HPK19_24985 [Arthrobacter citreus]